MTSLRDYLYRHNVLSHDNSLEETKEVMTAFNTFCQYADEIGVEMETEESVKAFKVHSVRVMHLEIDVSDYMDEICQLSTDLNMAIDELDAVWKNKDLDKVGKLARRLDKRIVEGLFSE